MPTPISIAVGFLVRDRDCTAATRVTNDTQQNHRQEL